MTATPDTAIPDRIALTGRMGAGKTHVANLLEEKGWMRLSFATPLKEAASLLQVKPTRHLLQELSTVTRNVEPHPLVEQMRTQLEVFPPAKIVVDDVRFNDELTLLREHGFVGIRVVAPVETRRRRLKRNGRIEKDSQMQHISESPEFGVGLPTLHNYRSNGMGDLTDPEIIATLTDLVQR